MNIRQRKQNKNNRRGFDTQDSAIEYLKRLRVKSFLSGFTVAGHNPTKIVQSRGRYIIRFQAQGRPWQIPFNYNQRSMR